MLNFIFKKAMQVINYSEFSSNLAESLNMVNNNSEVVIVERNKGDNIVFMSLEEYESLQETLYIMSSKTNQKRLDEAIEEMNSGKYFKHGLIED